MNGQCGITLQRARGDAMLAARMDRGRTRLCGLRQRGSAKILLPRNHRDAALEAVFLNTAGGMTGGDRFTWTIEAGADTQMRVTSQAAERVYRAASDTAVVSTQLRICARARLEWLPQETILFDGARLERLLDIEVHPGATLLAVESIVLGRRAHGEQARSGSLVDRWRVHRDGRPILVETLRLNGLLQALMSSATGNGAAATATVLLVAPDAEQRIDAIRAMLPEGPGLEAGASAFRGMVLVRMLATNGDRLRPDLAALLARLGDGPLPRVWQA